MTYSWNHGGVRVARATSSMLQIDTVDSTKATPAASAARAACTSARVAILPPRPTGARRHHPAEADRREDDRQREPPAEHLGRGVAGADVAHDDLPQEHPPE